MNAPSVIGAAALALIVTRWLAQLGLNRLNQRQVRAHAGAVPAAFSEAIDPATYAKTVDYTLAKGRLSQVEDTFHTMVLLAVICSGVLPWALAEFTGRFGHSAWAMAAFLLIVSVALTLPGLPFDWHAQFGLEERFGFNTSTPRLWWIDRAKGLLLAVVLGYPLLALVLKLVEWSGPWWWLWAWGCVLAFQVLMLVIAPILILPWFNKFTPLSPGTLRDRLHALGERTGFHARTIQVMDGSKRSRHSNAYFTGFGRFRKIVLFDTLIVQLSEPELEAVLAHEIGHYKKKHIPKLLLASAASLFAGFWLIAWLAGQGPFYEAFGFQAVSIVPALLLFGLLGGTITFWFSPLANLWSRRYEYQADAYAAQTMKEAKSLIGALRKLNEKNLSNLTPHPLYSGFYYSHPGLLEREMALKKTSL
jgi:STE24 endopeptidase